MRREREPIPRARNPWGWLAGILTLGLLMGGTLVAAIALWENVDIQRLTRVPGEVRTAHLPEPRLPPPARPVLLDGDLTIALYWSEATANYFSDPDFYRGIVRGWEERIRGAAGDLPFTLHTVGTPAEVEALEGVGLVVAAAAVCLADREAEALLAHANTGGGLLATWATGARDASCEWRGWDVVERLTERGDIREVEEREGLFLTIPAGTPLSSGLDPATRVELRWDAQLAAHGEGARVFWSDWALNPVPAAGTDRVEAAAVVRDTEGGGRIVWFGFTDTSGVNPLDDARLQRLLSNGVRWAAGLPSAQVLPWPHGRQAALVLAQEVGGEFVNAQHTARVVADRGVPATWFVVSRFALQHPELAGLLAATGEVASQTADNAPLAGLPESEQATRLRRSVTELRGWAGEDPIGLRAPEEAADAATLGAWASLGGRYVVGLNEGRTGSPELLETPHGPIVLLPRALKDDFNLIVQERVLRPEELSDALFEGVEKLGALGGLALLTTHTQLAGTARLADAVGRVLDRAQSDGGWWIAPAGEVAEWVLARAETAVTVRSSGPTHLELLVEAPADRLLEGAWIGIDLPGGTAGWAPRIDGAPVGYAEAPTGVRVPLPSLPAGGSLSLVLEREDTAED